jgi:NADH-quinone oxidoreductase subunit N
MLFSDPTLYPYHHTNLMKYAYLKDSSLNFILDNLYILLPEFYLFFFINILLLYGVIYNTSPYHNYPNLIKNIGWLSIQTLIITIFLIYNRITLIIEYPLIQYFFHESINISLYTAFFKIFVLILSILCIFISFNYLKNEKINTFEYQILLLIVIFGSLCLISSNDFLILYLAIEIISLSLYILASYNTNSSLSAEASLKYVILGSFSSGLFLFGSSLFYGFTGTINFNKLYLLLLDTSNIYYAVILGLLFFFISFLFKLGAAPFHMWVADVYEGVPISVTIFLTTVPKIAIFSIFTRLMYTCFYSLIDYWQPLLTLTAIISIVFITFVLVSQKKIKRFLAYSSIVHMGYLLLGISLGTLEGVYSSFLYLIIYMVNTINIWTILISLNYVEKQYKIKYISDLNFLYKINPLLTIVCALSLLSMAGIPPLAGFFAKFYIFLATLQNASYLLAFVGLLTSVISSFYYIRIIKVMYFEAKKQHFYYQKINYNNAIILSFTTLFIIFFIFILSVVLKLVILITLSIFNYPMYPDLTVFETYFLSKRINLYECSDYNYFLYRLTEELTLISAEYFINCPEIVASLDAWDNWPQDVKDFLYADGTIKTSINRFR